MRAVKVDGSVVVWDLRESSGLHRLVKDSSDVEQYLRQPTYNTGNYRISFAICHACDLVFHVRSYFVVHHFIVLITFSFTYEFISRVRS
jgi:hypothetical protein